MYTEFKIIYIGLGIIAALLLAVIILLVLLFKKISSGGGRAEGSRPSTSNFAAPRQTVSGVVFCPNCGTQFDAKHIVCPKCGKPR